MSNTIKVFDIKGSNKIYPPKEGGAAKITILSLKLASMIDNVAF